MAEISILRPKRNLISIPVNEAVYCESCSCVSNSVGGCCGLCGNMTLPSECVLLNRLFLGDFNLSPS